MVFVHDILDVDNAPHHLVQAGDKQGDVQLALRHKAGHGGEAQHDEQAGAGREAGAQAAVGGDQGSRLLPGPAGPEQPLGGEGAGGGGVGGVAAGHTAQHGGQTGVYISRAAFQTPEQAGEDVQHSVQHMGVLQQE